MALYTIQLKRGQSSTWKELNPILNPGEPGFEIDTNRLKIGNGIDDWNSLIYTGEEKRLVINAQTVLDFPQTGETDVIYKASQEKQLYQWNDDLQNYEILLSNEFVTEKELEEVVNKIGVLEVTLKDYATKDYVTDSIVNQMISLSTEEILEICK